MKISTGRLLKQEAMDFNKELIDQAEREAQGLPYPGYVQKMKDIGVANYEVRVRNHNRKFTSKNGEELLLSGDLPEVVCVDEFDLAAVKGAITRSQEGLTDYPTFLSEIAAAGVHNYLADLGAMKVLYMGREAGNLYTEIIPAVKG